MNVFSKVTLQTLKKNRTRTIVTIIGIMLSTALICAVTTSFASAVRYMREEMIYYYGDWHGSSYSADFDTVKKISEDDKVDALEYLQNYGYAKYDTNIETKPYFFVVGASKNYLDMLSIEPTVGRLPETPYEIALPDNIYNWNNSLNVGDELTLDICRRYFEGELQYQENEVYYYDEIGNLVINKDDLELIETRKYKIVGVYGRELSSHGIDYAGFPVLTVADDSFKDNSYGYDFYFRMNKPKQVYDFMDDNQLTGRTNSDLLITYGVSKYDNITGVMSSLLAIVIGLIVFGSVALIYNAFAISVSERTKQFGLLSSIGATKKQIRHSVFFEAFVVSIIGIPLGILLGIAGIGVTLSALGDKFASFTENNLEMKLCISPLAIIAACVVALATVFLSALKPARAASKVTAVEAIRQTADIKASYKKIRTPKLVYKIFGLPGMLAHKYFKRSKKRYRATILSLFLSIVLFVSASALTENLIASVNTGYSTNSYDLVSCLNCKSDDIAPIDDILAMIKNDKNTKKCAYTFSCPSWENKIDKDHFTESGRKAFEEDYGLIHLEFVNDSEYDELLKENGFDPGEHHNKDVPHAIAIDGFTGFNPKTGKFQTNYYIDGNSAFDVSIGFYKSIDGYNMYDSSDDNKVIYRSEDGKDYVTFDKEEMLIRKKIRTIATTTKKPYYYYQSEFTLVLPFSEAKKVFEEKLKEINIENYVMFFTVSKNHKATAEFLSDLSEDHKLNFETENYAAEVESMRSVVTIVRVFAYGFIILISLIAAANVFNTISTNVALRRREFAMLRSVGMTAKGIWKMLNFECIIYGIKALLYGLPVSGLVCVLIKNAFDNGFDNKFIIPWNAVLISVFSVFLVVFSTMLYSMNRIKKDNPIDALKNENI